MKKKGFATSAILYTLLLLFLVLMVGILNNLQNKKTILDALKKDTINALEKNTITDAILDQIGIINSKIVEIETKISNYEANTYTKTEIDNMFHTQVLTYTSGITTQAELDAATGDLSKYPGGTCTKEYISVNVDGLVLTGGAWVIETCNAYGYLYQTATIYRNDSDHPILRADRRSYPDTGWSKWKFWYPTYFN